MIWLRAIREYVDAIVHGYQSFVLGLVFGVTGAIALFTSDQNSVRAIALAGVALGFLVAPFRAFRQMRQERDAARSGNQFGNFVPRYVNWLSGSSWGIDSFQTPNEAGLIVRAIAAALYPLASHAEIDSSQMDRFCDAVGVSALERWFIATFGIDESDEPEPWALVAPSNGFETTVRRRAVMTLGGGSEIYARCMLELPRGVFGVAPRLVVDLVARDIPKDASTTPNNYELVELAGAPYKPSLGELFDLLDLLAETLVTDLAPILFSPMIRRPIRERLRARLTRSARIHLAGPNFDVRSKPRDLADALEIPDFPRLSGGYGGDIMVETPAHISPYNRQRRHALLRRGITVFLRGRQYRHFEEYVAALGDKPGATH